MCPSWQRGEDRQGCWATAKQGVRALKQAAPRHKRLTQILHTKMQICHQRGETQKAKRAVKAERNVHGRECVFRGVRQSEHSKALTARGWINCILRSRWKPGIISNSLKSQTPFFFYL